VSDRLPIAAPPTGAAGPPITEQPDLDALVSGLADLDGRPVAEHHDRLVEVHEALHAALHTGLPEQPVAR